jgi:hypothetical protein
MPTDAYDFVRVSEPGPGELGAAERWCVRQALRALGDPPFSLIAWTGEEFPPRGAPPQGRLRLRDRPRLRDLLDERFERIWRLYLASSLAAFRSGSCQLYQVLFARQDEERLPWTREWIYRGVDASEAPV